ncbi:MAG: helix-hairpin-helix domain-containing protein, partial [Candidatus Lokiarchaeota archaeon]|nr:helix-hairpin-helix domain-containing protein [Candidatus Lokiarchaeota archaeon]
MTNVFENSQKLVVENAKEKSFNSPKNAEDLTVIKGIGPGTALKLNRAKIYTFKQLAKVSPEIISEIPGINITTALKFIRGAKNLLGEFPEENSFIGQNKIKEKDTEIDSIEPLEVAEVIIEEEILQEDFQRKKGTIETTQEEWFNDKSNYSRLTASYPPISENSLKESDIEIEEIQEHYEQPQVQIENEFNVESFTVEKPNSELDSREEISTDPEIRKNIDIDNVPKISNVRDEREKTRRLIEESLKKSGYYLIPNTFSTLNSFIENIDYIGCKLVRVSRGVNHIFILPIKMCDLEGTVLVDEAKLDYNPKTNVGKTESMSRLRHYSKNLLYARDLMFDDIIVDGIFREFFQKYLQVSLTLEKSVENKKLFFKSGQTQYKVL